MDLTSSGGEANRFRGMFDFRAYRGLTELTWGEDKVRDYRPLQKFGDGVETDP